MVTNYQQKIYTIFDNDRRYNTCFKLSLHKHVSLARSLLELTTPTWGFQWREANISVLEMLYS